MTKNNSILVWVIMVGILLRIMAMAFFVHPDLKSQYFHGQFLSKGVVNIHKFLSENTYNLPYRDSFNYPVLTYYFLGTWEVVSRIWLGDRLEIWLNDWGQNAYHHPQIFSILLTLKLPYLIFELIIFTVLWKTYTDLEIRKKLVWIWALNPITLYGIYMIGQFDIIPAGLCLLALLLWHKNKNILLPLVFLTLATGFKSYPILIFPFFLFRADNWKTLIKSMPIVLIGVVLLLTQPQTGLIDRIFLGNIELGYGQRIPIFFAFYSLCLLLSWKKRHETNMWFELLSVPLLVIGLSHFNAQWVIWSSVLLVPLFALDFKRFFSGIFAITIGFFGVVGLLDDRWMTFGLLTPLNRFLDTFPSVYTILSKWNLILYIQSISHGLLLAGVLWLLYQAYVYDLEK